MGRNQQQDWTCFCFLLQSDSATNFRSTYFTSTAEFCFSHKNSATAGNSMYLHQPVSSFPFQLNVLRCPAVDTFELQGNTRDYEGPLRPNGGSATIIL